MVAVSFKGNFTPEERVAFVAWAELNRNRYGSAQENAFIAGLRVKERELQAIIRAALEAFFGGRTIDSSSPSPVWDALSHHDQLDHIEACWGCTLCAEGRAFGSCTSCGDDPTEALPPEGLSRCCGSVVNLWGPE